MSEASSSHPYLVGYDGRPHARDALALGAVLARATHDPVLAAWVYGPDPVLFGMDPRPEAHEDAVLGLADAQRRLSDDGLGIDVRAITGESAAAGIYALAADLHPHAIVVGSCHRGAIGRLLIGTTAGMLLEGSAFPVIVAPTGYADRAPKTLTTITVGFDGRSDAWAALQHAAQIGAAAGATLRIVTAVGPFAGVTGDPVLEESLLEKRTRQANVELVRACESVSDRLHAESEVIAMDPRWALEREAERDDVDLIVVGSRGFGPLHRVFVGSASSALMRAAACPVMVVPRSVEFDPSAEGMAAADEIAV